LSATIGSNAGDIDRLETSVTNLVDEVKEYRADVRTLDSRVDQYSSNILSLQSELNNLVIEDIEYVGKNPAETHYVYN
jgi:uncharacterized protein YlxW (UPF0749 family)